MISLSRKFSWWAKAWPSFVGQGGSSDGGAETVREDVEETGSLLKNKAGLYSAAVADIETHKAYLTSVALGRRTPCLAAGPKPQNGLDADSWHTR